MNEFKNEKFKLVPMNFQIAYFFRFWVLIFLITIGCTTDKASLEIERWKTQADQVTIIRDDFGVPHIYGKTDADAVFGLLYAQCEDDFSRVERNYIWATGRLAEVEGEDALYSDLRAKLFMTQSEAEAAYESSPQWLKELCNAFADGINFYLYSHPEVRPKLLTRFEPWMPMYFSEGSIGGDIERVSTTRIKAFYEENKSLALSTYGDGLTHPDPYAEPKGSNGFAISGDLTESGDAMLLINPHTSFFFRGEVHVVSEEGLNAYGAVTWGQFFVYQGFNERTGWMHTSTYTDVIDEFKETIEGDRELTYLHGEELRPVETDTITLKYIADDDSLISRRFPVYRTHHGPITHKIGDQWVSTAMMWEPVTALQQSFIRTKQEGYKGFREMMDLKTNSSNNTVYADAEGNIAYFHGNFIPIRDEQFDYSKPVEGSDPATDWKGLHDVDEAITILNPKNGWIQNCNSTPFTAALENSPIKEDYPYYMSTAPENFRGIHAIRLLKEADELTLDQLITLAYDPVITGFEELIPGLVLAYDQAGQSRGNLKEAIDELRNWDFKVSKSSKSMTLAHFYGMYYLRNGEAEDGLSYMERVNYFGNQSPLKERLDFFEEIVNVLTKDFGSWKVQWGEVNRYQRISGDIKQKFTDNAISLPVGMASGRWGALASYGSRKYEGTKRLYGTSGNSFVAVVEFGDKVKAKSLLAGGQSGNPSSKHFDDQAKRYIDRQFKEVAFYKEDVLARARSTYHPGE